MAMTETPSAQACEDVAALVASRRGVTAKINSTDRLVAARILEALPSLGYMKKVEVTEPVRTAIASGEGSRTAMEVFVAHDWFPASRRCGCGARVGDFALDHAAHLLDVLTAVGMTVTFPQRPNSVVPHTPDENGRQEWITSIGKVAVFDDGETRIDSNYCSAVAPVDLRSFADALYSAAAAAEHIAAAAGEVSQ